MQDENKKKKKKRSAPKLKCFTSPFENKNTVTSNNAYNVFYDSIGNDIFLSDCDPNGSYTGITRDGDNRPVQDVDDL
ncbi:MAG: hypothetical protein IJC49_05380 [Clostridia bacterium]|nr:hypothetical protein [Clostridia bacterium]